MLTTSQFQLVCILWIILAIPAFILLLKRPAPYGRHREKSWGPLISNRAGWLVMELPVFIIVSAYAAYYCSQISPSAWLALGLFLLHYFHRCFIYPFRLNQSEKKMPLLIVVSAVIFNLINGNLIGISLTYFSMANNLTLLTVSGILIFATGLYVNLKADTMLLNLRNNLITGYKIPQGWLFEKVSCPNYLGEIIEWIGFAIIANNLAAWSFVIWTFANLFPRALKHHQWYKTKFKNYPESRKALLPHII